MALDKPQLIYTMQVERQTHIRRFLWGILATVAGIGAWGAFWVISGREDILTDAPPNALLVLQVGQVLALGVVAVFAIRSLFSLVRIFTRRTESAQFYDRGFMWTRGNQSMRYSWGQVQSFKEGARVLRLGFIPLGEIGAHTFTMRDGQTLKFTPAHGDPRAFADAINPYLADILGERMGRLLRDKKSVRVHPQLVMHAAGVQAGNQKIRWSELDVAVKNSNLLVQRKGKNSKFKTVKSYPVHQVDNLGGFMELATSTIKNYQPERFNIKTQTPTMYET